MRPVTMSQATITLSDIRRHTETIRPTLAHTPLLPSNALSRRASATSTSSWNAGSPPALSKSAAPSPNSPPSPRRTSAGWSPPRLATTAWAWPTPARVLGLPAIIFVPETAPAAKVSRLAAYDCHVRRAGSDYDSAHALAEAYAQQRHGATYLSAYDDPVVIAGQGTAGLEILEDLPHTDMLLVPVGGGGLIAGIAIVAGPSIPSPHHRPATRSLARRLPLPARRPRPTRPIPPAPPSAMAWPAVLAASL